MSYDVGVIGGGPGGQAAALALGRAGKRVLLFNGGSPRNARAPNIHNFVTRDGTPPEVFREIAQAQLSQYSVEGRTGLVESITGRRGEFVLKSNSERLTCRRVILCTGMVDDLPPIPGFKAAWGHSIFKCPYCHGWEVRGKKWGILLLNPEILKQNFPALLQSWTDDVVVFTNGVSDLPAKEIEKLGRLNIRLETRPISSFGSTSGKLEYIDFSDGGRELCEVLYAHTPQHQVGLVNSLNLELDEDGYVRIDPSSQETSTPGIYAAGDLTTSSQGAIFAASKGAHTGGTVNFDLMTESLAE